MRILFIGSVLFSKRTLERVLQIDAQVVGIVTKEQSDFNTDFFDLSPIANQYAIPVKYAKDINHPNVVEWMRHKSPDVIFCFGWSNLISIQVLKMARLGVVGYHPSLLPYNRGRHPLIWAKCLGLEKTGSTFFFMDEGADTGDILSQVEIPITFDDDASTLYEKMTETALRQIDEFVPLLQRCEYRAIPQDKKMGNTWRKRSVIDGQIDFRMSTSAICNLVRALTHPYAGAHCRYKGADIKIWRVTPSMCTMNNIEPGKIINLVGDEMEVKTYDGSVTLKEHDFAVIPAIGEHLI
jgi:methionyl-tRNA formyltransferase